MFHVIATDSLCRRFQVGDTIVRALDDVSLTVTQGDFVAVMGPSGSGKSTLMNILGCLDRADDGSYRLLDQSVASMDDVSLSSLRNRYIGFVFQGFHLLPRLTALENVLLPLRFAKDARTGQVQRASDLMGRLGLGDRMHHRPNQLSGGQRQRAAIARALVMEPPLLLADEPTGNLDSRTSGEIMDLFVELNDEGQTILVVTHEDEIAMKSHRVILMRDGRIERESSRRERVLPEAMHAN
ncbi:MAG: ABC transporter ATP-binding protein [Pseudomonadales bacterium]|nr:ABC transporter ATP-binding protein [Pseudomonadales bacterium]